MRSSCVHINIGLLFVVVMELHKGSFHGFSTTLLII